MQHRGHGRGRVCVLRLATAIRAKAGSTANNIHGQLLSGAEAMRGKYLAIYEGKA